MQRSITAQFVASFCSTNETKKYMCSELNVFRSPSCVSCAWAMTWFKGNLTERDCFSISVWRMTNPYHRKYICMLHYVRANELVCWALSKQLSTSNPVLTASTFPAQLSDPTFFTSNCYQSGMKVPGFPRRCCYWTGLQGSVTLSNSSAAHAASMVTQSWLLRCRACLSITSWSCTIYL